MDPIIPIGEYIAQREATLAKLEAKTEYVKAEFDTDGVNDHFDAMRGLREEIERLKSDDPV